MANFFVLFATVASLYLPTFSDANLHRFGWYIDSVVPEKYKYIPPNSKDFEFKLRASNFDGKSLKEMKGIIKDLDEIDSEVLIRHYTLGKDPNAAETVARHYIEAVRRGDGTEYDDPKPVYPNPPYTVEKVATELGKVLNILREGNVTKEQVLQELKKYDPTKLIEDIVVSAIVEQSDPLIAEAVTRTYLGLPPNT